MTAMGDDAADERSAAVVPLRPASSEKKRSPWAQWPMILVLIGVAVAMVLIAMDYFRRGCVVLSASIVLAAFLRLLLPDAEAGWLAVRSRKIDVAILFVLGLGITIFTFWVPPPS